MHSLSKRDHSEAQVFWQHASSPPVPDGAGAWVAPDAKALDSKLKCGLL